MSTPFEDQFQKEWAKLDRCGEQKVDLSRPFLCYTEKEL